MAAATRSGTSGSQSCEHAPGEARVLLVDEAAEHEIAIAAIARPHGLAAVSVDSPMVRALPQSALADARIAIVAATDTPSAITRLKDADPALPVLAMGETEAVEEALACIRAGAEDYLCGPMTNGALHERLNEHFAECAPTCSRKKTAPAGEDFGIIGESRDLAHVREMIARMVSSEVTTLIEGPTGSGKEVVALALHRHSPRAGKPLVALNCAALPDDLIEGELFGYERGAFSGATTAYPGKLALADGGTLFLDEIGELSAAGQAKLLRAIEARQCYRLGGRKAHNFDVRVIAATNRDLKVEVAEGRFRSDLYYRIAVAQLSLSGLSARRADIAPLAEHFLQALWKDAGSPPPAIAPDARSALERHDWPGNARELRNAMEVALLACGSRHFIHCEDLPLALQTEPVRVHQESPPAAALLTATNIRSALTDCNGNKSAAARALGCSRMTLYRHLRSDPGLALSSRA